MMHADILASHTIQGWALAAGECFLLDVDDIITRDILPKNL